MILSATSSSPIRDKTATDTLFPLVSLTTSQSTYRPKSRETLRKQGSNRQAGPHVMVVHEPANQSSDVRNGKTGSAEVVRNLHAGKLSRKWRGKVGAGRGASKFAPGAVGIGDYAKTPFEAARISRQPHEFE